MAASAQSLIIGFISEQVCHVEVVVVVQRMLPAHVPGTHARSFDPGYDVGGELVKKVHTVHPIPEPNGRVKSCPVGRILPAAKEVETKPRGGNPGELSPAAASSNRQHAHFSWPWRL